MCTVNDSNPRRRHRAAYLAPARALRPQIVPTDDGNTGNNNAHAADDFDDSVDMSTVFQQQQQQLDFLRALDIHTIRQQRDDDDDDDAEVDYFFIPDYEESSLSRLLFNIYCYLVDYLVLLMAMVLSFFFYNVEFTIVKPSSPSPSPSSFTDEDGSMMIQFWIRRGYEYLMGLVTSTTVRSHHRSHADHHRRRRLRRHDPYNRDSIIIPTSGDATILTTAGPTTVVNNLTMAPVSPPTSVSSWTSRRTTTSRTSATTRTRIRRGFPESVV